MISKEKLKEEVDFCFERTEKLMSEHGSLAPMLDIGFIADTGKGGRISVVMAVNGEANRRFLKGMGILMGGLKKIDKIKDVDFAIFMAEAWFSTPTKAEVKLMKGNLRMPSEDPNRKEALIASALTKDKVSMTKIKEMFSVVVKGKKHFTLTDVPEMKQAEIGEVNEGERKIESILDEFYLGYDLSLKDTHPVPFLPDMTFEHCLVSGIKSLTKMLDMESKIINNNKI